MKTEIIKLDKKNIEIDKIKYAAEIIKNGGLVAFPTETVYGLGANALDENALGKIFKAKGRPSDNPLIVHISEITSLKNLVKSIPAHGPRLMERFWPGPLTLIMEKSQDIPYSISAGLDTVAVRMPSHPIALALIREAGVPIAAPSANTSGKPSPTNARHVFADLSGKVELIIDGGNAKVGLESTVLDIIENPPVILRPGGITPIQLQEVLGKVNIDPALMLNRETLKPKSPGMKYTHYSPKAEVIVVEGSLDRVVSKINKLVGKYSEEGKMVGVLVTEQTKDSYGDCDVISMGDRDKPETIASSLFRALREFDEKNVDIILAEAVDNSGIGLAVMNRMNKAAGYNIIKA